MSTGVVCVCVDRVDCCWQARPAQKAIMRWMGFGADTVALLAHVSIDYTYSVWANWAD